MNKIIRKYHSYIDHNHISRLVFYPIIFEIIEEEELVEILIAKLNDIETLNETLISFSETEHDHFEVALYKHKREWFDKYRLLIDERLMWIIDRIKEKESGN